MDTPKIITYDYKRRFGVEIEVNSLDRRDFFSHPLEKEEMPEGMNYIGELMAKKLRIPIQIHPWHYTNNNNTWVLKPDRSCGIEICSPVDKGNYGINQICQTVDLISQDNKISIDPRCSFHVHVNLNDCRTSDISAILSWWIKCESVFIDSLPQARKNSRYCQCIGASDIFFTDFRDYEVINQVLGQHKYFTLNTYHMCKNRRKSMEFRILGNEGCKDSTTAKYWIKLLIHFVEMAKRKALPNRYGSGPWHGLLWLDPKDVFKFLGFMDYELDQEMTEIRDWFLRRLKRNAATNLTGFWSRAARAKAIEEVDELVSFFNVNI